MDDGFVCFIFFHWGNGSPHTPHLSLSPKGVREMATVHSEMTGRRVGGGGQAGCCAFTVPSYWTEHHFPEPQDTTLQGNGRFPLLHGEVPKGVFVIFRLEETRSFI